MPHFNLVDEPWIQCVMAADNRGRELSLREVLAQAPAIREIYDPSPLVTVSLHRLLLAVLHRNFGPANTEAWVALWRRGAWAMERLDAYFSAWRHRFDLFDAERPFYQVPYMEDTDSHDMAFLALELVAGNSPLLFDHRIYHNAPGSARTTSPAQAARLLLVRQGYSIGFGKSKPFYFVDGHLTRGYTVLATGATLFETLVLNLMPYNEERPIAQTGIGKDLPHWEQETPAVPERAGTMPLGYLDYLTWQSRRIHLIPNAEGTQVIGCQLRQNLVLTADVIDPFKSYRLDEKRGRWPRSLQPQRAIWRDSHSLLAESEADPDAQPRVFRWLGVIGSLREQGKILARERYAFSVFGLATEEGQAANLILWRQERLPLPLDYLSQPDLLAKLDVALQVTEAVAGVIRQAVNHVARLLLAPECDRPDARQPDREAVDALARSFEAEQRYWAGLDVPMRQLLVSLATDRQWEDGDQWVYGEVALPGWVREVRAVASRVFEAIMRSLDTSARSLKAVASASGDFHRRLGVVAKEFGQQ
jgi:CRISPR system Cascade subunit CasA